MEIIVESREEAEKLCRKLVFDNMVKLPKDKDNIVVDTMMAFFDMGMFFEREKKVKVAI